MILQHTNHIAETLLKQVKQKESYIGLVNVLRNYPLGQLKQELKTDANKTAFWINVYNAYFQIIRLNGTVDKPKVYTTKAIVIAGLNLSLDDIEHGILRRYRYKKSLGYLPDYRIRKEVRKLSVEKVDFRIHFALNCGAVSCPPIRFYSVGQLDELLDLATLSFLEQDVEIKAEEKEVYVTRLFLWFLGDFGGKKGVRLILEQYLLLDLRKYKIKFKDYNWDEVLDNYV